jgi:hypothetical protein
VSRVWEPGGGVTLKSQGDMIWGMRRLILFLVATFLFSCAAEAQTSNSLIRPGDVLIIKVLRPFSFLNLRSVPYSPPAGRELLASKTLVVNADGRITPPRLQRMEPIEDITVDEAAKRVRESYVSDGPVFLEASGVVAWGRVNIVIERATVGQVLSQLFANLDPTLSAEPRWSLIERAGPTPHLSAD